MKPKLHRAFNRDNLFGIIILMILLSCRSEPSNNSNNPLETTEQLNDELEVLIKIINPLLDSNRYFFINKFSFPPNRHKSTIDLALAISDTLYAIDNCGSNAKISTAIFDIDTDYSLTDTKNCLDSKRCVLAKFSRICFIGEATAYLYMTLYRDSDFAREDKINVIRRNGTWRIKSIKNIWIS